MFTTAIGLFAVAALVGVFMAFNHLRGRTPPHLAVALLHGALAASGLLALVLAVMKTGLTGKPAIALGLFLVAALGGFTLLSFHLRRRALPSALVLGHAVLAATGFVMLLVAVA
jgi:hypothetical protein